MTRGRLTDAATFLGLIGRGALQFGGLFWPWAGYLLALVNLVFFLLAMGAAWLLRRLGGNR